MFKIICLAGMLTTSLMALACPASAPIWMASFSIWGASLGVALFNTTTSRK
jgi:hypothetical protein